MNISSLNRDAETTQCVDLLLGSEPWITLKLRRDAALASFADPEKEIACVRDAKGVAGFAILDMRRGLLHGYIQILCVRPDCRGQGIGTALLRWAEERIFRDSPNVFICVSSFNDGARRLYARLGFSQVATFTEMLVPGHDEYLLRKTRGSWAAFRDPAG